MSQTLKTILIAGLVGLIAAFVGVKAFMPDDLSSTSVEVKETAYERVMRTGKIRCGYVVWPPYFDIDPNTGEMFGYYKDVIDATLGLIGLEVDYVSEYTIGNQAQDLNSGKFDSICGDGPWNINASKYVDYTDAIDYLPVYIYVRGNESRIQNKKDLNNEQYSIVAMDGDLSEELARVLFPKAKLNSLSNISDPSQLLVNVQYNKADAVIVDALLASAFLRNNPGVIRQLSEKPLGAYPGGFSVRKGETELTNMLNMAIEMAVNLGIYEDLAQKNGIELGYSLYSRDVRFKKNK